MPMSSGKARSKIKTEIDCSLFDRSSSETRLLHD